MPNSSASLIRQQGRNRLSNMLMLLMYPKLSSVSSLDNRMKNVLKFQKLSVKSRRRTAMTSLSTLSSILSTRFGSNMTRAKTKMWTKMNARTSFSCAWMFMSRLWQRRWADLQRTLTRTTSKKRSPHASVRPMGLTRRTP